MTLGELEALLVERLADLPGTEGQLPMSPVPRYDWVPGHIPEVHRLGAGLLPLYQADAGVHLVLTERNHRLPKHPGQISLPGGAVEDGESIEQAAIREAHEEVAIDPEQVRVLGRLTPLHIPVSGFVLHPVVAVIDGVPELRPEENEVERILDIPLDYFSDPVLVVEKRRFRERFYHVPYYLLPGDAKLWGATAMVVTEFLALLGIVPDPWGDKRPDAHFDTP